MEGLPRERGFRRTAFEKGKWKILLDQSDSRGITAAFEDFRFMSDRNICTYSYDTLSESEKGKYLIYN